MEEEIKKDENDIEEDERELEEESKDIDNNEQKDDIEEDEREETESVEDLKKIIADQQIRIETLEKDLEDAHNLFLNTSRESKEPKERNYKTMLEDIN